MKYFMVIIITVITALCAVPAFSAEAGDINFQLSPVFGKAGDVELYGMDLYYYLTPALALGFSPNYIDGKYETSSHSYHSTFVPLYAIARYYFTEYFFAGVGPLYAFHLSSKRDGETVPSDERRGFVGIALQSGVRYNFTEKFFIELFFQFSRGLTPAVKTDGSSMSVTFLLAQIGVGYQLSFGGAKSSKQN